jgi:hypothetical protein
VQTAAAVTIAWLRALAMGKVAVPVYLEPKRFVGMDACQLLPAAALMGSSAMRGTSALLSWGGVVIMYV